MTIVDPFYKTLCPYCFERFYLGEAEIVSSNTTGKVLEKPPTDSLTKWLNRVYIKPLSGPEYTKERAARRCPYCANLLPHNIEYMDNRIIAMVGAGGSGKSHYIASLIKQIEREGTLDNAGCLEFAPVTQEIEELYTRQYYEPLFVNKVMIKKSQPTATGYYITPLVYVMVFGTRDGSERKRVNLILFDAAGEDISDQVKLTQVSRYILNASAIIFLEDPITIPSISQRVRSMRPDLQFFTGGIEGFRVLQSVTDIVRRQRNIRPGEPLPIPLVITLAKSDLVRYCFPNKLTPALWSQPDYSDGFKLHDYQTVNDEVKELLRREDHQLLQVSNAYSRVSFSAVSATGMASENDKFKDVQPRRCVDPLLWILWQLGMIQAK